VVVKFLEQHRNQSKHWFPFSLPANDATTLVNCGHPGKNAHKAAELDLWRQKLTKESSQIPACKIFARSRKVKIPRAIHKFYRARYWPYIRKKKNNNVI